MSEMSDKEKKTRNMRRQGSRKGTAPRVGKNRSTDSVMDIVDRAQSGAGKNAEKSLQERDMN